MIKLFADGANMAGILEMYQNPRIDGFTTNPTLMRKAGITDYVAFAKDLLREISDKPISFEVFADEFNEMEHQALDIAGWGKNVFVKIPVMNTKLKTSFAILSTFFLCVLFGIANSFDFFITSLFISINLQ